MPFVSRAQSKWMFANKPEMAKEWASKTNYKKLPERVGSRRSKKNKKRESYMGG